jgi:hypothetical protein
MRMYSDVALVSKSTSGLFHILLALYDTDTTMLTLASCTYYTLQIDSVPAPAAAAAAAVSVESESAQDDDTSSDDSSGEASVEESADIGLLAKLFYADGFVNEFVHRQDLRHAPMTLHTAFYELEQWRSYYNERSDIKLELVNFAKQRLFALMQNAGLRPQTASASKSEPVLIKWQDDIAACAESARKRLYQVLCAIDSSIPVQAQ